MAEPNSFGNSNNPSVSTTSVTKAHYDYAFEDLPAGSTLEMKLTVPTKGSATKTLTVPPGKTAKDFVLNLDGFLV